MENAIGQDSSMENEIGQDSRLDAEASRRYNENLPGAFFFPTRSNKQALLLVLLLLFIFYSLTQS